MYPQPPTDHLYQLLYVHVGGELMSPRWYAAAECTVWIHAYEC